MNASDVLHYGHDFVLRNLADLPQEHWDTPNVCGWWSTKNILAHLASFEYVLNEVTLSFIGSGPMPYMEQYGAGPGTFNDFQVDIRKNKTAQEVLDEYTARHEINMQ
ncbi:MAG: maleylpyruvate isomerase N-terminal domain-containing protein, partial [Anaerolineales bacterium]